VEVLPRVPRHLHHRVAVRDHGRPIPCRRLSSPGDGG
jgi:hypothetical protein